MTTPFAPPIVPQPIAPLDRSPPLWTHLEPDRRRHVAQHLAELIRRLHRPPHLHEEKLHDQP